MRRLRLPCAFLLLLLAGCRAAPGEEPPTPPPSVDDPTCSEEIWAAVGPLGTPGQPAEAHAETYGDAPTPFHVRLQWPTSRPHVSSGFLWRTDVDTLASVVEWGIDGQLTERTEGASFVYGSSGPGTGVRIHEARLCGKLQPSTTYSYRVGGEGGWSPIHTFATPGAPGSFDTVTVAMAGDSRGAYTTWASVLELMAAHEPDLYLFSGDMVDVGGSQAEWDSWFEAAGDLWTSKVLIPAHGNHEFLAVNYFGQFALPGNEQWFSIDYGPLHIVSLNDTVGSANDIELFEVAFLRDDLAVANAPWTIVQHHQAAYSATTAHGSNLTVREAWTPVFDEHGVDVVLAGHNHAYERSVRITGDQPDPDGITYLVAGGAGAPLYTSADDLWFTEMVQATEHYIIAEITGNTAVFTVRDLDDTVIDTFTITK